jgi:hypothetical protein
MAANKNSENNWGGMAPSSKKITTPKVTLPTVKKAPTPAPKPSAVANYFQGTNLTGIANTLKNAPKPAVPSWAQNLTNSLKTNPNAFSNYLGMGKTATNTGKIDPATGLRVPSSVLDSLAANSGIGVGFQLPAGAGTVPRPTGTSAGTGVGGGTKYMTPEQMYVDPTAAYQPVLDYLKQQEQAARDRYAVNNANIKNVFSALTGLTAADSARITKQFTDSLTASKADLAARTAEARAGAAAGTQQAAATGAERGTGDAMAVNPVQTAAEEGIARSNEYATTWQALQNANQQQAMADISARGAGYGQQEVGAIQQLAQNLEDKLLAIGGNTAQVQSDIAQAKFGQQVDIQKTKFQLSEQAKAEAKAAAAAKPSYSKDLFGLQKLMTDNGQDFGTMTSSVDAAYTAAWNAKNPIDAAGMPQSKTVNPPKAADVKASWIAAGGSPSLLPYVDKYVSTIYG